MPSGTWLCDICYTANMATSIHCVGWTRAKTKCMGTIWEDCTELAHPLDATEIPQSEPAALSFQAAAHNRRFRVERKSFCDVPHSLEPLRYDMPGSTSLTPDVGPNAPFSVALQPADAEEDDFDRCEELPEDDFSLQTLFVS